MLIVSKFKKIIFTIENVFQVLVKINNVVPKTLPVKSLCSDFCRLYHFLL